MGHSLPDLLGGEAEDGSHQTGQSRQDGVHGGLTGAAGGRGLAVGVQTILGDVHVELGQIVGAEGIDGVVSHVELVAVVGVAAGLGQLVGTGNDPLVDLVEIGGGDHVGIGVEVTDVGQQDAGGVTDLAVDLGELTEDGIRAADVHVVVAGGGPQTEDIRAVLFDNLVGIHAVTQRLVHGAALAVHHPAVGQHLLEGCAAIQSAHRGEQRGLEPTAVLIRAFQIDVGGPEIGGAVHKAGVVGGAGIEPAVQGVLLLGEGLTAAMRTGQALGDQLHGLLLEPDVGAELVE